MGTDANNNQSLAVLIDADNASAAIIEGVLAEVAKLGVASIKRIYGDWTTPQLGAWKEQLLQHAIQPVQQFRYTVGKNATDSAMIIDAMDLLHAGQLAGFCLVSSDSDFTRLATRLRESGCLVYGFGEQKTPKPFVAACDRFFYTEIFVVRPIMDDSKPQRPSVTTKELRGNTALMNLIRRGIEDTSDDNGWAHLGQLGSHINKAANDFDPRNYGYTKLSELIQGIGLFAVDRREKGIFVRDKRGAEVSPTK